MVASLRLRAAELAAEPGSPAAEQLGAARAELDAGLSELRELARGIHPTLLTTLGLMPAVEALAARCAVPVELEGELGERLPPAVETALYYTVAEALTNVDRYAGASHATVSIRRDGDVVALAVADDGRGGADRSRGSGLRGLEDRLSTVGGELELDSPPGRGTVLRVRVPLAG